ILYGPYRRADRVTAPSNDQFDAALRAHDARWGVRAVEDVSDVAAAAGFVLDEITEMPANNLTLVFRHTHPLSPPPSSARCPMDNVTFNCSIRKFLEMVGVQSQREIEQAVDRGLAARTIAGN